MENQAQPQGADNDAAKAAIAERKAEEQEQEKKTQLTLSALVQHHATGLLGDQRAAQFAAQLQIMKQEMPQLANCTGNSILSAMMACVHVNVMPNTPQQEAAIIPYGDKATFQMMFRGLKELAYRSGQVNSINAECVFRGDTFDIEFGSERKLTHKPDLNIDRSNPTPENVTHVYITTVLANGEKPFFVMTTAEIEKIHKFAIEKNRGKDTPAWKQWWGEMAKKTVLKRAAKTLPSSSKDNRFQMAVYYDNLAEAGKLKFDERTGNIIEGEVAEAAAAPASKEIKNYAAGNSVGTTNAVPAEPSQDDDKQPPSDSDSGQASRADNGTEVPAAAGVNSAEPTTASDSKRQDHAEQPLSNDAQADDDGNATASSETAEAEPDAPKLSRQDMLDQTNDACQSLGVGFAEKLRKYKELVGTSNIKSLTDEQVKIVFDYYTGLALQKTNTDAVFADEQNEVKTTTSDRGKAA